MKTLTRFVIGFMLVFSLSGLVLAQEETTTPESAPTGSVRDTIKNNIESNVDYEEFKTKLLNVVAQITSRVEIAEANIKTANIHPETKALLVTALDNVLDGLADLNAKIVLTDSYDDVEALNAELKALLAESAEEIKNAFREGAVIVLENSLETFEDFQEEVQRNLDALKIYCPDQLTTIESIEADTAEMDTQITALATALTAEEVDVAAARATVKSMTALAKSIAKDVETLSNTCSL